MLTSALSLDVREVFHSFGFDHLITNYDEDAVLSVKEFIRLHKLKHPSSERLITNDEQEILLNIIHAVFGLSQSEVELSQLAPLLKEIQKLREVNQIANLIEVPFLDTTFYVDIKEVLAQNNSINQEKLKAIVQKEIASKGAKLLDIQKGSFVMNLEGEKWIAEIRRERVTFLTRMDEVINL